MSFRAMESPWSTDIIFGLVMMRGALYSAQGWLGKETRKASVAIAEGFGLL